MTAAPDGPNDPTAPGGVEGHAAGGLRAKDVLTRSEAEVAELEATLDPVELAQLQQWFAKPSRAVIEEQIAEEGSDSYLEQRHAERQLRIAEASKSIEPRMIALLDRHVAAAASIVRPIEPPPAIIDETIITLKPPPADQDAQIGDARDYIRDQEIEAALAQAVPQAVLRDLYRAETDFQLQFTSPYDEAPPEDPRVELRLAIRERRTMPQPLATYNTGAVAQREFRDLIAGPWADKVAAVKASREGS